MKTNVMVRCGNAPKMEKVINLTIALADRDVGSAKKHLRDDFVWSNLDGSEVLNYGSIDEKLPKRPEVSEISVANALSHGDGAMCEGILDFEDNDRLYYCSIAKFSSTAKDALIKELHFYFSPVNPT